MTTTPGNASSDLPGKPPVVDLATWQAAREELLVRCQSYQESGRTRRIVRVPVLVMPALLMAG
ncbi:hypothetical protein [Embleya sp. NBC_00896]|uniref:hypothetical protein n=1 Tax=Embleya sp. NBC_00896 TaxID=2975961 RepID=UPI00386B188C